MFLMCYSKVYVLTSIYGVNVLTLPAWRRRRRRDSGSDSSPGDSGSTERPLTTNQARPRAPRDHRCPWRHRWASSSRSRRSAGSCWPNKGAWTGRIAWRDGGMSAGCNAGPMNWTYGLAMHSPPPDRYDRRSFATTSTYTLNQTQLTLVVYCFNNFPLQSCVTHKPNLGVVCAWFKYVTPLSRVVLDYQLQQCCSYRRNNALKTWIHRMIRDRPISTRSLELGGKKQLDVDACFCTEQQRKMPTERFLCN